MAGMYETDQPMKIAELGDTIFIAESTKTPFGRLLKRGKKPVQMLSQWPVQLYPDRAFGGTMDGTDISSFNHTTREQMEAYGMWLMTEGYMVSKLAALTRTAGVKTEDAKQAADDSLILAQMIEKQLLSNDDTALEAQPSTPFTSRGAFQWLSPTAQSTKPVPANFRPSSDCTYSGALASFTPSSMETMLEAAATAKKGPVDLTGFVGIKLKTQMSTWAQKDTGVSSSIQALQAFNMNAADKKLMRVVDFFEFDAGMVRTIVSWYLYCTQGTGALSATSTRGGLFVDLSMWELCFLQAAASYVLPPQSGGRRGYHDAVYILKCLNPLGQCRVTSST